MGKSDAGFTVKTTYTPAQIAQRKAEADKIAAQRKRATAANAQRAKDIAYNKATDRFNADMAAWNKSGKGKRPRWRDYNPETAKAAPPRPKAPPSAKIDLSTLGTLPTERPKPKATPQRLRRKARGGKATVKDLLQ